MSASCELRSLGCDRRPPGCGGEVADLRVEMEARETRMGQRMFNFAFASVGIVLAAIGIATGLIVALG